MAMAHQSGNSGKVLGGGFEYKIPVKNWAHGLESGGKSGVFNLDDLNPYVAGNFDLIAEGGGAVEVVDGEPTGEVTLTLDGSGTDLNLAVCLASKRDIGLGIKFVSGKQCAAAVRFKIDAIPATAFSLFAGLINGGETADEDNIVDTTGAMDAIPGCGLHLKNSVSSLDLIYGTTLQKTQLAAAKVLIADTYVNFSVHCDGTSVRFFVDGVQVGGKVAMASVATTDLKLVVLSKVTTENVADIVITVDSFAVAQER